MFHHRSNEKEQKQQAVIDAASDSKSSTTAADAGKAIIEESRKAGAVAYEFDANATPEQKAARAAAVSRTFPGARTTTRIWLTASCRMFPQISIPKSDQWP